MGDDKRRRLRAAVKTADGEVLFAAENWAVAFGSRSAHLRAAERLEKAVEAWRMAHIRLLEARRAPRQKRPEARR